MTDILGGAPLGSGDNPTENERLYVVIYPAAKTAPANDATGRAQIKAGQDGDGTAATWAGSVLSPLTTAAPFNWPEIAATLTTETSYKITFLWDRAGTKYSNVSTGTFRTGSLVAESASAVAAASATFIATAARAESAATAATASAGNATAAAQIETSSPADASDGETSAPLVGSQAETSSPADTPAATLAAVAAQAETATLADTPAAGNATAAARAETSTPADTPAAGNATAAARAETSSPADTPAAAGLYPGARTEAAGATDTPAAGNATAGAQTETATLASAQDATIPLPDAPTLSSATATEILTTSARPRVTVTFA